MNEIIITGNLTREPQLRRVNGSNGEKPVTTMNMAVNTRRGQNEKTDFFRVTVWGAQAESCAKYLNKGSRVLVRGELHMNEYDRQDGTRGAGLEVEASQVEFLGGRSEAAGTQSATSAPAAQRMQPVEDDSDLPF